MAVSRESVQKLFAEQVGRPIEPALAEAVAAAVGPLAAALNAVAPEPIFLVEPSIAFQAGYNLKGGK